MTYSPPLQLAVMLVVLGLFASCSEPSPHSAPTHRSTTKSREGLPVANLAGIWNANPLEVIGAERVARDYASSHIDIPARVLAGMEAEFLMTYDASGVEVIIVGFFDREFFPRPSTGVTPWPLGGFPCFFSVTVAVDSGAVCDQYTEQV